MPRTCRTISDGGCYHVLNRGNGRQTIFHKEDDYAAFLRVLNEGLTRVPSVSLYAYCLMPNHWHFVVGPRIGSDLGKLMAWVGVTHARRHHEQVGSALADHEITEGDIPAGRERGIEG